MPAHPVRVPRFLLPVVGLVVGFAGTFLFFQDGVPAGIAPYQSVALLAGLDSVFGGIRAGMERRFRSDIFLSGFLVNMLLTVGLVWMGETIGVEDIWIAAIVTLGGRIFTNLSLIRRYLIERHRDRAEK